VKLAKEAHTSTLVMLGAVGCAEPRNPNKEALVKKELEAAAEPGRWV
jgi:hypothetical protein